MKSDIETIQNFIYEHDDFEKYREKAADSCSKDNKTWNLKGRTLSYMYRDKECEILKEAMRWYSAKNLALLEHQCLMDLLNLPQKTVLNYLP